MKYALLTAALLLSLPAMAQEAPGWMPPGPGQQETATGCTTCHALNYIRMNSVFLSAAGWKVEVGKMQKVFGAPFDDETAAAITSYLDRNFAAQTKQ